MFGKLLIAMAMTAGITGVSQATESSAADLRGSAVTRPARVEPYAVAGPVHVRFRRAEDAALAASLGNQAAQTEIAVRAMANRAAAH